MGPRGDSQGEIGGVVFQEVIADSAEPEKKKILKKKRKKKDGRDVDADEGDDTDGDPDLA